MSDALALTAAEASGALAAGELDRDELFEAYRARAVGEPRERVEAIAGGPRAIGLEQLVAVELAGGERA